MSQRSLLIAGFIVLIGLLTYQARIRDAYVEWSKPPVPSEQPRFSATPKPTGTTQKPTPTPSVAVGAINLAVPFSSQAPRGDWSLPWQEACEETSALLVDAFWKGESPTIDQVESQVLALVAWQNAHFGFYKHTTAAETATMIREVYGYKRVEVRYDITIADIVAQVRAGRPVIVPLAGRLLGNPYYTSPGPVYHMLVVKGVAEDGALITNDVGTRHGRNLTYAPDVFLRAIHDVPTGGDEWAVDVDPVSYVQSGRRAMIVVYPN